jgi:hypothetical protein
VEILKFTVPQASKLKGCEKLLQWLEPIRNHFWHCAETCEGDVEKLKASFISCHMYLPLPFRTYETLCDK